MTLARCKAALLRLIDDQENRVIALSGKWGTGKTELWKQVRGETVDAKAKDAVLVSLFGVSTITELKLKIAEGLAPKLGEGHFDAIKAGIAGFKKVLKGFHSSFSALDELSLLAVPYMLKGRFIVIDDIERKHTKLTIDEILGFIDECVQNHECRILLVLNSDKLEDQKLWGQIREKVVDQEIKLETSPSEAFDIAQKLTPCPWPQQMKLSLEPFQITNIRIIRKVIRAANQLLSSDPTLSTLILKRALPSISLLGAIHYEAVEDAPSSDFIRNYDGSKSATIIAIRKKQTEPLTEEQKDHDRWHQVMNRAGIASTDELEMLIMAFFDSGVLDAPKIQNFVREYLQRGEHIEARKKAITFIDHLEWHPQLSEENLVEELRALLPSAGALHMGMLSRLVPMIDQLTDDKRLGLAFVEAWRAEFRAQHPEGISEDWLQLNGRPLEDLHSLIRNEIDSARTRYEKPSTSLEVFEKIMKGKALGTRDEQCLRSVSAQEFEAVLRAANGPDLQQLLYKGMEIVNGYGAPLEHYAGASQNFLQACHDIIHQQPGSRLAKIIDRELKVAGLNAQSRTNVEPEY